MPAAGERLPGLQRWLAPLGKDVAEQLEYVPVSFR